MTSKAIARAQSDQYFTACGFTPVPCTTYKPKKARRDGSFIALTVYSNIGRSFKAKRIAALANEAVSAELKSKTIILKINTTPASYIPLSPSPPTKRIIVYLIPKTVYQLQKDVPHRSSSSFYRLHC